MPSTTPPPKVLSPPSSSVLTAHASSPRVRATPLNIRLAASPHPPSQTLLPASPTALPPQPPTPMSLDPQSLPHPGPSHASGPPSTSMVRPRATRTGTPDLGKRATQARRKTLPHQNPQDAVLQWRQEVHQADDDPALHQVDDNPALHQAGDNPSLSHPPSHASSRASSANTLSNPDPLPMGSVPRYTQVQRQPPSLVPILKHKGTSQRDRLLTLANPDPSQSQMHGLRQPVSTSEPASTNPVDSRFRSPPPLPVFYHPKSPPPVSSTQRAVVDGGDSQASYTAVRPRVPFTWDYRPSPVPQPSPQFPFPQSTLEPTDNLLRPYQRQSFSPENQSPGAEPSNVVPNCYTPSPEPQSLRLRQEKPPIPDLPIPGKFTFAVFSDVEHNTPSPPSPRSVVLSPEPDPNSVTVSETESEPTLQPKPGRKRRRRLKHRAKGGTRGNASNGGTKNPPSLSHAAHIPGAGHAPSSARPDTHTLFQRLNESLDRNGSDADIDMDTLLRLVNEVRHEQRSHATHPSTSQATPNFPASHNQSGTQPSHSQLATSSSHRRAGPASQRDDHQHPKPNTAANSGDELSDDELSDDEYDPMLSNKKGLGRYPGVRGWVASCAIPKMMSTASQKGVYQDHDTAVKWARNAYRRAWKEDSPHILYRECPKDLLQTIITRVYNLCTLVKERIRKIVRFVYGFEQSPSDEATMSANRLLAARLGHNTFHCRDTVPEKNQYEHCALMLAIYEAFFWSPDSFLIPDCPALKQRDEGLPLVAVAFVLTMMQECIEEWATGRFLARDLNLTTQRGRFDSHLWGLLNYRSKAGARLLRFQHRWLNGGLEHAASVKKSKIYYMIFH
ncbi:hypothetical protein BDV93DRAFT_564036 [Ceratobasidium sp. AG-I]|nr:hypothetical protein BDV93DRAFT_564036 [Ceratobasidium sp. AG-I]